MIFNIYFHQNCMDGLASAWAYNCYHNVIYDNKNKCIRYIPYDAGQVIESEKITENTVIYCLDYCPTYDNLVNLLKNDNVEKITIIDHHKIDVEKIKDLDPFRVELIHDIKHSGCVLAYSYFNNIDLNNPDIEDEKVPSLFYIIEDRDLWKWTNPNSKYIMEALFTKNLRINANTNKNMIKKVFDNFSDILADFDANPDKYIEEGQSIIKIKDEMVKTICNSAKRAFMIIDDKKYKVWEIATRIYKSEVGHNLLDKPYNDEKCDFSVMWEYDIKLNEFWLALRSDNNKVDVSAVAKSLGGGGHRNAAGITLTYDMFRKVLISDK